MTAEEISDPLTFLSEIRDSCPEIDSILTTDQLRILSEDAHAPLDKDRVDEHFIEISDALYMTKISLESAKSSLRTGLIEPRPKKKKLDSDEQQILIKSLKKIHERFFTIWRLKLEATEEANGELGLPRLIRLSRRLKLTDKETQVIVYLLVMQVGRTFRERRTSLSLGHLGTTDPISTSRMTKLSLIQMADFLSSNRLHMKQGLFPNVQQTFILQSNLGYDDVTLRALVGASIKANDFLKLEQTCLADVIAEEAGNEHLREKGTDSSLETRIEQTENKDVEVKEDEEEGSHEEDKMMDLDELLRFERLKEKQTSVDIAPPETEDVPLPDYGEDDSSDPDKLTPYKNDLEYLDDNFQLIAQKLKVKSLETRMEVEAQYDEEFANEPHTMRQKREAESKAKVLEKKCEKRLALTKQAGMKLPRLERMVESRGLVPFEKNIILTLIGFVIQPNKIVPYEGGMGFPSGAGRIFSVGELVRLFCTNLHDQIKHRVYFYKMATLVREGMIIVNNSGINGDPTTAKVEIDRRMLDFCVGLDTEFSEIVEGSHLYFPKTQFDQVILSKEQKSLILNTVSNFEAYKRCRKKLGMDDAITYGAGMVILFHGAPGTGKTMMANALANKMGNKVLLINFPSLGSMSAGENFKFIFREAKINNAILFFDECEAIFETRDKGNHDVNTLLTEIERHDGLIIMATNRPYDLDEAMHRRIMLAIEFRQPDHILRKTIWESHIPQQMQLADDVDLNALALRFELTGGFIKNAILSALSIAVSRDGDAPMVCHEDLLQGANLQLRGRLRMKDFHRRLIPARGLDQVIIPDPIMKNLKEIIQFEKARSVLFGQWGFDKTEQQGLTVLFHGLPGTGKSLAAEAVGYEVGKPLKLVNCGELLSKWVGESTKNIDSIFEEARSTDAILVFDEAEGLFGQRTDMKTSTDRYANVDVGVLLYHIERFPGIIILTTNLIDNMDKAFFRRLKFVLHFDTPSFDLRKKLWKLLIPGETPLEDGGVDYDKLAHYEMSGGDIKSTIFRAAARAALRTTKDRLLKMSDLEESCKEEIDKLSTRTSFRRQDSSTADSMYN